MNTRNTLKISVTLLLIGLLCLGLTFILAFTNQTTGHYNDSMEWIKDTEYDSSIGTLTYLTLYLGFIIIPCGILGFALVAIKHLIKWLISE